MPEFAGNHAGNHILRALWSEAPFDFRSKLQFATLSLGEVLHEPGERLNYVYFPTSCVIALVYTTEDGSSAEMGLIGNDGVLGIELFLGGDSGPHRAQVQIAGDVLRVPASVFRTEISTAPALQRILLRYTHCLLTQISQTAVCNRLHPMERRLCRWLLMCHDRSEVPELLMTQELLANVLGGRRESVTVAAGHLQDAGLIHYRRGHIKILDRPGLESNACECYRIVEEETGRLFRGSLRADSNAPEEALAAGR